MCFRQRLPLFRAAHGSLLHVSLPHHILHLRLRLLLLPQVILVRDVPGLGSEGSLKSVPVGYFRNYLQPQGLAAFANAGILDQIKRQREEEERARMEEKAKAQAMVRAQAGQQAAATPGVGWGGSASASGGSSAGVAAGSLQQSGARQESTATAAAAVQALSRHHADGARTRACA